MTNKLTKSELEQLIKDSWEIAQETQEKNTRYMAYEIMLRLIEDYKLNYEVKK